MDDLDLHEVLESSFASEPPLPSVRKRVLAGRKALRRRRILTGVVAVGAVCAGVVGVIRPGAPEAQPGPVGHPAPQTLGQVEQRLTEAAREDLSWRAACNHPGQPTCRAYAVGAAPVSIDAHGALVRVSSDVIIAKRTHDSTPGAGSRRIEVEVRTPASVHPQWWVVTRRAGHVTAEITDPSSSQVDFATWARAVNSGTHLSAAPARTRAPALIQD